MPGKSSSYLLVSILGFAGLVIAGCGPTAEQKKIQDLIAETDQLKRDLEDRDRAHNDMLAREGEARQTIDELNRELASLRANEGKQTDGWITMPSFDMISIPGSVLFASGKAELTSQGRGKLAEIASDIRARYADRDIYVFGHTDNEPIRKSKWKDNWELGAHRSLTVVRALRGNGIAPDQLIQANCGEFKPRDANSAATGRQQNRRVEFYAVKRNAGIIENTSARGPEE